MSATGYAARILIVEDEGLVAQDLSRRLREGGYTVLPIADDAASALEFTKIHKPNLVLMDIRLRGPEDGIEIAGHVRREFHLPVIFCTAHVDKKTLDGAKITQPFGYIVKPFHNVDLRVQIEFAFWKHQMEQRLRTTHAWLLTAIQNVVDGLITIDSHSSISLLNAPASEMTGWDCEDAIGKPFLNVFCVFDPATGERLTHVAEVIPDPDDTGHQLRTFRLSRRGSSYSVLVEAAFSSNRTGEQLLGSILVFRDLSSRPKAQKENRHLRELISFVARRLKPRAMLSRLFRGQTRKHVPVTVPLLPSSTAPPQSPSEFSRPVTDLRRAKRSSRQMLNDAKRIQHVNSESLSAMPPSRGCGRVELHYFCLGQHATDTQVSAEYVARNLEPDLEAHVADNAPNLIQSHSLWRDNAGNWHYLRLSDSPNYTLTVARSPGVWGQGTWFPGVVRPPVRVDKFEESRRFKRRK